MAGLALAKGSATTTPLGKGISPALCGAGDAREPGIQGEVPAGQTASYNCGIRLVGQLPVSGNVQGVGSCAYVRARGAGFSQDDSQVYVIDVRDPTRPVVVGTPLPVHNGSESMRAVVTGTRAVLVSGSSVYDISDCLHPKLAGEIDWPQTPLSGVTRKIFPHDIRVNRAGTKVYATFGIWDADITDLTDTKSWKVTDHRCELAAQQPGPWQELHRATIMAGRSLCDDATRPAPRGANYLLGASPLQASLLWPQLAHSPDFNGDDTRMYVGDQAGGTSALWAPVPKLRIIDITQSPMKIIGEVNGPGHGLDWFHSGRRDYVLHSNEGGAKGIMMQPDHGDTCRPDPRPSSLGWAFEAFISDVTDPAHAQNIAMLRIAINDPTFCDVRKASGRDPWIAYHLIDNPMNPKFAMVNFGDAGFRIFDIRNPAHPSEVAYFNHGAPVHAGVGYYDAARGLIYASDGSGFKVLEVEPQVRARLGL
jgi:hypothetical protein